MKQILATFCALIFTLGPSIQAQEIEIDGANDTEFRSLLQDWLEGDEKTALTSLAGLAQNDHIAAQIFLGQLSNYAPHTLLDLSRDERLALRAPKEGRKLGKSWLVKAQDRHPFAWALANTYHEENYREALTYFMNHGETYMQGHGFIKLLNKTDWATMFHFAQKGQVNEALKPWVAFYLRSSALLQQHQSTDDIIPGGANGPLAQEYALIDAPTFSDTEQEFVSWGRPSNFLSGHKDGKHPTYPASILQDAPLHQRLMHLAQTDVRLAPVRDLCERVCPEEPISCTIALKAYVLGYTQFWHETHSPIEAFISTSDHRASARYTKDMRHRLLRSNRSPEESRPLSLCFANYLQAAD